MLRTSFDNFGNFAFGIDEHIKIPQTEYEASIGLWGLDVCGRIVRPGMRVKYRRKARSKIPAHHYVSRAEAQFFLKQNRNNINLFLSNIYKRHIVKFYLSWYRGD